MLSWPFFSWTGEHNLCDLAEPDLLLVEKLVNLLMQELSFFVCFFVHSKKCLLFPALHHVQHYRLCESQPSISQRESVKGFMMQKITLVKLLIGPQSLDFTLDFLIGPVTENWSPLISS